MWALSGKTGTHWLLDRDQAGEPRPRRVIEMMRQKSIIGALVLCALSLFAVGAANASAKGLTAVKCVEQAGGKYKNANCSTSELGTAFETVALTETTEVEGAATNASGGAEPSKLRATLGGLKVIVQCEAASNTGKATNVLVGEEMKIHGTEVVITYSECNTRLESNETRTCEVEGTAPAVGKGKIQTNKLTVTSTGVEHQLKFEPEGATPFTKFTVLTTGHECFFKTAVPVEVTGAVEGDASTTIHSHVTLTKANNGTGLKANGAAANYEGTNGGWMKGNKTELVGAETF